MRWRGFPRRPRPRPARIAHPGLLAVTVGAAAAVVGCGADPKVQPSTTPVPGSQSAAPSGSLPSTASGRFTGADVPNRFGDVQVQITVAHGRITDVAGLTLPTDRARSRAISQQAAPLLRSEVLAAQSARIDLVSGASYTSDSWASSVQSALSQVH